MTDLLARIEGLKDNEGFTIKNGEVIRYKTGYQVGIEGITRKTAKAVLKNVLKYGSCGIWKSDGVYYIDKVIRASTKKEALIIGRAFKQLSIYSWITEELIWL